MRILHCYAGNLYGGLETFLSWLARRAGLAPDLEHEFALCFPGRLADELRAAGAAVHDLGAVRFRRPWTVLRARRRLARVLAERRPDVVVAHESWPHILGGPVARRAGRPLVFWMQGVPLGHRWFERLARRTPPDLVLANSRYIAGTVDRLFPGAPRQVVYYPVEPPGPGDAEARAAVRRELGTPEGATVILQSSRFSPYKGHALLVEALGRLRDDPRWEAWIAGGVQQPSERAHYEQVRAAAREAGIAGRVRFLGERSDVPRLLAAADIHCQPNVGPEPFGIAFVEALYAGLPVVSTRMGGAAEIVTEECGRLVEPEPGAVAGALAALLADPGLRARLGAAGPSRARALCEPAAALGRLRVVLARLVAAEAGGEAIGIGVALAPEIGR